MYFDTLSISEAAKLSRAADADSKPKYFREIPPSIDKACHLLYVYIVLIVDN